jgi:hypothetical protein
MTLVFVGGRKNGACAPPTGSTALCTGVFVGGCITDTTAGCIVGLAAVTGCTATDFFLLQRCSTWLSSQFIARLTGSALLFLSFLPGFFFFFVFIIFDF